GAFMQTLGISAIVPFVQAMLTPQDMLNKKYIGDVLRIVGAESDTQIIIWSAVLVILVYLVKDIYLTCYSWLSIKFRRGLAQNLSCTAFRNFLSMPYTFYLKSNTAEIMQGIGGDITSTMGLFASLIDIISETLTVCAISIYLIYTDWMMSLGVLALCFASFMSISKLFHGLIRGVGKKQREASKAINKWAYQSVNGIKEINVSRRQQYFLDGYENAYEAFMNLHRKVDFLSALPNRIIEVVVITGMVAVICFKITLNPNGDNTQFVASLSAFALAVLKITPSISSVVTKINSIGVNRPSLNAAVKNVQESQKYRESQSYLQQQAGTDDHTDVTFDDSLEIREIEWTYPGTEKRVLNRLSLTIKKGEAIGLMGESGAGKTTLSDVILGLYRPQKGRVLVDGVDVYSVPDQWAHIVGYVPQSVFLLDDNIRNNILFGLPFDGDDGKIWDVIERASLGDFIRELPKGLDTQLGERGVRLSGGQKQRIAIARALYEKPQLLVLDEATSALDNETEKSVMESIDALQGSLTMVIVAHRLTTIKNCDRIYEIRKGEAIERDKKELFK
ncbi:MAG: ABC transporter ATP-binding protein/permease, partial [Lachnospiraceae bacterium]|nr:ABC transporter ATP-binding protein/permease [Lachnospiraceae bacterium]